MVAGSGRLFGCSPTWPPDMQLEECDTLGHSWSRCVQVDQVGTWRLLVIIDGKSERLWHDRRGIDERAVNRCEFKQKGWRSAANAGWILEQDKHEERTRTRRRGWRFSSPKPAKATTRKFTCTNEKGHSLWSSNSSFHLYFSLAMKKKIQKTICHRFLFSCQCPFFDTFWLLLSVLYIWPDFKVLDDRHFDYWTRNSKEEFVFFPVNASLCVSWRYLRV